jgi:hypothetical protein
MRQGEGLIAKVRQVRREAAVSDLRSTIEPARPEAVTLEALEARVAHLERLLEALQGSVYRESVRQSARIADLEARTDPVVPALAISTDARKRGL